MKILIIEDNPANMKLVAAILKNSGYEVLEADNADRGIVIARQEQPHLVLMDIQLPGMDGLTATRMLRDDPATSHLKIVALTASAMKGDEEKILASGCDGYIAKPFNIQKLLNTVQSFIIPPEQQD